MRVAWLLFVFLAFIAACHPDKTGKPVPPAVQAAARCKGDAPLPQALSTLADARGSWVPDPEDGSLLFVLEVGRANSAPPLVIFHGIGDGGIEDFFPVFAELGRSRRVIAVDLPGFGRSSYHSEDLGPGRLVRAVDAALDACGAQNEQVDLLGHSSGAPLALLFTSVHPNRVRRLIMAAPMGILRPEVLLHAQLAAQLHEMHEKNPVAAEALLSLGDFAVQLVRVLTPSSKALADSRLIGRSPGVLLATSLLDYNFGDALTAVQVPTLILLGKLDDVVPTRIVRLLEGTLTDPHPEFVADAGHVIMEDQPHQFVASVNRFLSRPTPEREPHTNGAEGEIATCRSQANMVIRGSYQQVVLEDCHHAWLDRVSAKRITVRRSEVRMDEIDVQEGVVAEASELAITAGTLRGEVALELNDCRVDMAGTKLDGTAAAIVAKSKESRLVLSVTSVHSPFTDRVIHKTFLLDDGAVR